MTLDPVAVAIPFFFAALGVEVWWARRRGARWHRLNDALADLGCGVLDQVLSVLCEAALLVPYVWLWTHARVLDLPESLGTFALAVVGVDLAYYWWHRLSHRVAWMWAIHAVHHQSTEYNLAVALRQDAFGKLNNWVFWLPLAVLGIPPTLYVAARSVDLLYQFWIHTRAIGKLGPVELVMNTPSHHRVHHGVNRRYIDKNYGGIFIVFDRLFGTFREEDEEPVYGTVEPFESWDPVRANLQPWAALWRKARAQPTWRERIAVFWRPPEWPATRFPTDAELRARPVYDADAPAFHTRALAAWVLVAVGTVGLLLAKEAAPWPVLAAGAVGIGAAVRRVGITFDAGSSPPGEARARG